MPTAKRKLDLKNLNAIAAIEPGFARTDNRIMKITGKPCEIFTVQPVTDAEVNCQLQTSLVRVQGGVVINMTTGAVVVIKVQPLKTNASIAQVVGSLPADNTYIVLAYGTAASR